MNKRALFFIVFVFSFFVLNPSLAYDLNPNLANNRHMKQFNIFEKEITRPLIFIEYQKCSPYCINTINFERNRAFSAERLNELLQENIGQNLDCEDLAAMKNKLLRFYKQHGYKSAIINVSNKQLKQGIVTFEIYEGSNAFVEEK